MATNWQDVMNQLRLTKNVKKAKPSRQEIQYNKERTKKYKIILAKQRHQDLTLERIVAVPNDISKWDASRFTDYTRYICGQHAHRVLGYIVEQGEIYWKHNDVPRYPLDEADLKLFARTNLRLPLKENPYFLLKDDIDHLVESKEYKNKDCLPLYSDAISITLPRPLLKKMRIFVEKKRQIFIDLIKNRVAECSDLNHNKFLTPKQNPKRKSKQTQQNNGNNEDSRKNNAMGEIQDPQIADGDFDEAISVNILDIYLNEEDNNESDLPNDIIPFGYNSSDFTKNDATTTSNTNPNLEVSFNIEDYLKIFQVKENKDSLKPNKNIDNVGRGIQPSSGPSNEDDKKKRPKRRARKLTKRKNTKKA